MNHKNTSFATRGRKDLYFFSYKLLTCALWWSRKQAPCITLVVQLLQQAFQNNHVSGRKNGRKFKWLVTSNRWWRPFTRCLCVCMWVKEWRMNKEKRDRHAMRKFGFRCLSRTKPDSWPVSASGAAVIVNEQVKERRREEIFLHKITSLCHLSTCFLLNPQLWTIPDITCAIFTVFIIMQFLHLHGLLMTANSILFPIFYSDVQWLPLRVKKRKITPVPNSSDQLLFLIEDGYAQQGCIFIYIWNL